MKRRKAVKVFGSMTLALLLADKLKANLYLKSTMMKRQIGTTGEYLPVVGLGTWQTFDVGRAEDERSPLRQVLNEMMKGGGRLIDSSPMYARAEEVIGSLTQEMDKKDAFFYATKVWMSGEKQGRDQMNRSLRLMKRETMDLMQIHNLKDWKTHLRTIKKWKEEKKIRYWGITHYLDSAHSKLEQIIKSERPDFVQFNYSMIERAAENSLLQTALDHQTAVIVNRPYYEGRVFQKIKGKGLPKWCEELKITSWGQYFLKFIISHPAVNCVIPGTSKPHHAIDNMSAGYGPMPSLAVRKKMAAHFHSL